MIPVPTPAEIAGAFRAGVEVRAGRPIVVRTDSAIYALDLVSAMRGAPAWHARHSDELGVLEIREPTGETGLWVAGMSVPAIDAVAVDEIRRIYASIDDPHSAEGEDARMRMGLLALSLRDAHIRAEMLARADGWVAIGAAADVADEDPRHGILYEPLEGMRARILVVRCPSTGRRYGHLVPAEMLGAREARRWLMGLSDDQPDPDVET